MATLRITEAELARDLHGVLAKVQEGVEVIVEQDHRAVASDQDAAPSQSRDLLAVAPVACGNRVSVFQRTSADEQVVE